MEKETVAIESDYHLVYVRTPFVCLLHWVMVASVVTLAVTGLYIGGPELLAGKGEAWQTFVMAKIRLTHFFAATALCIAMLLRLYHSFSPATRHDIMEVIPTPSNIMPALRLMKFYITGEGEHDYYRYLNPLGGASVFVMICTFLFSIATGFTLYSQQANPIAWSWLLWFPHLMEWAFRGMNNVRLLHHLAMYVLMAQVVLHIYMKVYVDIVYRESDIASIIAGYKVFHKDVIARQADRFSGHTRYHGGKL